MKACSSGSAGISSEAQLATTRAQLRTTRKSRSLLLLLYILGRLLHLFVAAAVPEAADSSRNPKALGRLEAEPPTHRLFLNSSSPLAAHTDVTNLHSSQRTTISLCRCSRSGANQIAIYSFPFQLDSLLNPCPPRTPRPRVQMPYRAIKADSRVIRNHCHPQRRTRRRTTSSLALGLAASGNGGARTSPVSQSVLVLSTSLPIDPKVQVCVGPPDAVSPRVSCSPRCRFPLPATCSLTLSYGC